MAPTLRLFTAGLALGVLCTLIARPAPARADAILCTAPTGTRVQFALTAALASNVSKTGQAFAFTLTEPLEGPGCTIPVAGTTGAGTVVLAGASGPHGHEGDLTLTLDTLRTADGRQLTFDDQRIEINGGNRKVEAGALNVVPDVGIVANLIRGKDIRIEPGTPLSTVLLHPAVVRTAPAPAPASAPAATPGTP